MSEPILLGDESPVPTGRSILGADGNPTDEWVATVMSLPSDRYTLFDKAQMLAGASVSMQAEQALKDEARNANPEMFERDVVTEQRKLQVRQEAERRVAGADYVGSEELTWDDLDELDNSFIIEDFLPDASICFLVARPNLGKTFAYIDMIGSAIYGLPWLGKTTRPVKVTIVLGEGRNGFKSRLVAWSKAHGVDPNEWPNWVTFINGANLMSDESLDRVRQVADRNGSELIVWDTWANVSGLPDNDKDALVSEGVRRALTVRPDAANLFVHHPTKATEDTDVPVMRGSGAMAGRADVVMTMYRDRKFSPRTSKTKRDWLAVSTEMDHAGKNRNSPTETIRGLYLDRDQAVFAQSTEDAISKESVIVRENLTGSMTAQEFADAADVSLTTARRHLNKAVAEGIALKRPGVGRADFDTYHLAPVSSPVHDYSALLDEHQEAA